MNKIFKSVWNHATGAWVAVSELAGGISKGNRPSSSRLQRIQRRKLYEHSLGFEDFSFINRFFVIPKKFSLVVKGGRTILTALLLGAASSQIFAVDIVVDSAGDDSLPQAGSLAHALANAASGDNIIFSSDVDFSSAANWPVSAGYTFIKSQTGSPNISFDLGSNRLYGSDFAFVTGTGRYVFSNGTIGEPTKNIAIGSLGRGEIKLDGAVLRANELTVGGTNEGVLTLSGGALASVGSLDVTNGRVTVSGPGDWLKVADELGINSGGVVELNSGSLATLNNVNVLDGGSLSFSNGTADISGSFVLNGVSSSYDRSTVSGTGTLNFTGSNITVKGGSLADLSGLWGATLGTGQSFEASGVFIDPLGVQNFQTEVRLGGDLVAKGGTVDVKDGAKVSGVQNIVVENDSTMTVSGALEDDVSGNSYRAEVVAGGELSIGTANGTGTVNIKDGGIVSGVTNITLGAGNSGALNISGENAVTYDPAEIVATGELVVGSNAVGTLTMTDGGELNGVTNITVGKDVGSSGSSIVLEGVGAGNVSSILSGSGNLVVGDNTDGLLDIQNGAQLRLGGNAVLGRSAGTTGTLTLAGRGGSAALQATLDTNGNIVLGESGNAIVNINSGGALTTGSATLAQGMGSTATVTMNGDAFWQVGNSGTAISGYAKGDSNLTVNGGYLDIVGTLLMGGQNAGYGNALFGAGSELHMGGGVFRNEGDNGFGAGNGIGNTTLAAGSVLSGSGSIYAGNQFRVDGGLITAGSRGIYDFNKSGLNQLYSLGTLHITDGAGVDTVFNNATFQTQLDRGDYVNISNPNGKSDKVIVHGDLDIGGSPFYINISRVLDGTYNLVQTDGGVIKNYNPVSLNSLGANSVDINLNGKTLKGNLRVDILGGLYTTLDAGNTQLNLHVNSVTKGNVVSHWMGDSNNGSGKYLWDMAAKNFYGAETGNTRQFLDGDIVVFDDAWMKANSPSGSRVIEVTTDSKYRGNVIVPEVRVFDNGALGEEIFTWNGGSIFAYDNSLYTSLDLGDINGRNLVTPTGKLVKVGAGTLVINNANEFYGGVHLGGTSPYATGVTGGVIQVNNNKAFGSYNSTSSYLHKGVVFVHENSELRFAPDMTINNRFIVDDGKVLNIWFDEHLTIAGNNATGDTGSQSINGGMGGGIFIGESGEIVYNGPDFMTIRNNLAIRGGGIYTERGYTLAMSTEIKQNIATEKGGGIYAKQEFELRDHSYVLGNATYGMGGGIYVGYEGLVYDDKIFTLHGSTKLSGNLAGGATGGGLYADGGRVINFVTAAGKNSDGDVFRGGDVWFEGNYSKVLFDRDHPTDLSKTDYSNAKRNALHLAYDTSISKGAILNIGGPYNVYFFDPITGDTNTQINITGVESVKGTAGDTGVTMEMGHGLAGKQYGTVIFQDDSAYYGDTTVSNGATFRLEKGANDTLTGKAAPDPVYGRLGSLATTNAANNTFELQSGARLSGQGTIAADAIKLNGIVSLDTGNFSKDSSLQGKGTLSTADALTQGTLNLTGAVGVSDTANWVLNLSNTGGVLKNDRINVTGATNFTGATAGKKLTINIDNLLRGKYTVMTASGGITGYNQQITRSDAEVYLASLPGVNLAQKGLGAGSDSNLGRVKANSYVDSATGTTLSLELVGRNRHVTASGGGNWTYDNNWTFNNSLTTTNANPGGTVSWSKNDVDSPATNVFLNGDMVTLTGSGTYTLGSAVRPVDLFVDSTGAIGFAGSGNISTYNPTGLTDPNATTIYSQSALNSDSSLLNDYGIAGYTGKLYKYDSGTLSFTNTTANTFAGGIVVGKTTQDGGVIQFSNGNQLGVGSGAFMLFDGSGTLRATANTSLATGIRIANGKTATIDTNNRTLTVSGVISDKATQTGGQLVKTGLGTLTLSGANTFTGGMIWDLGNVTLAGTAAGGGNTQLGKYTTTGGIAGVVSILGPNAKTLTANSSYTIQNHFDVESVVGNNLTLASVAGGNLTISGVNIGSGADGGVFNMGAGLGSLITSSGTGGFIFSGNTARNGGAIYSQNGDVSFNSALTLTNNTATASGGAVYAKNITVTNNGSSTRTISGNKATDKGGVFYVNGGLLTFNASNGNITFSGNTAGANGGEAAYLTDGAGVLATIGSGRVLQFDDTLISSSNINHTFTKNGAGMVAFTGANNNLFYGVTNVNAGTFRAAQGASFGGSGMGTQFNLGTGSILSGGGTVTANSVAINGTISADSSPLTTVADALKIGRLNIVGDVTMTGSSVASLDVDLGTSSPTPGASGTSDQLYITGNLTVNGSNQVMVNIKNYTTGLYKLIDTTGGFNLGGFSGVNGVGVASGAFNLYVGGNVATNRYRTVFLQGDDQIVTNAGVTGNANQLWASMAYNNLNMVWDGSAIGGDGKATWQQTNSTTDSNWKDVVAANAETHFMAGDRVVFGDQGLTGANVLTKKVVLPANVITTEMVVNTNDTTASSYEFSGAGGITTQSTYLGTVLDPYFNPVGTGTQKLIKQGTGLLTFSNTGTNNFSGGIYTSGGTIAFNRAAQLGDGGNGIHFNDNAALFANDNITNLSNNIRITDGKIASLGVADGKEMTMSGLITGVIASDTSGINKTGTGRLVLSGVGNTYQGQTAVSAGTLAITNAAAVGGTSGVVVSGGANFSLAYTIDGQFSKSIGGAGNLVKEVNNRVTLYGMNSYMGSTNIQAGTLAITNMDAVGGTSGVVITGGANFALNYAANGIFNKVISGAGNLVKEGGATTTTLEGTNAYTGLTSINSGRLIAETVGAINGTNTTSGVVVSLGATLEMKLDGLTESGTLAKNISGAGVLEKTGTGSILTLTGNNSFTGGTIISAGQLNLGSNTAVGIYTGLGSVGIVKMAADGTVLSSDGTSRVLQNRIEVASGLTGSGATITTSGGDLTLNGATGYGNIIQVGTGSSLNLASAQNIFINGAIVGSGTLNKNLDGIVQLASNSAFSGTTNVNAGILRVIDGKTFGSGSSGTVFNVGVSGTLSGGGTVKADTILVNGLLTTDKEIFSSGNTVIGAVEKYGALTLDGNVTLDGFTLQYNPDYVGAPSVPTPNAATSWGGDLLKLTGGSVSLKGGMIDLQGTVASGYYLIADSSTEIQLEGGKVLDGLNEVNGVLHASYGGDAIESSDGPRGSYGFTFTQNAGGTNNAQIWLGIERNSLIMDWAMGGGSYNWSDDNWLSQQRNSGNVAEKVFNNGDYIIFTNNSGSSTTVNIGSDVMTSGFEIKGANDLTFAGVGGIRVADQIEAGIEGRYLSGMGTGTPVLTVNGKLQKTGTGTLTFENTGGNQFEGGIFIDAGTIAFNDAAQLGDAGKGINFTNNATLQGNETATLNNKVYITDTKVAGFNVAAGKVVTMAGDISDLAGIAGVDAAGPGRLVFSGNNDYEGQTTISGGSLAITHGGAVGPQGGVVVASGADFVFYYAADGVFNSTNNVISGAGNLVKEGNTRVTLDATVANTYGGQTLINEGTLAITNLGVVDGTSGIIVNQDANFALNYGVNGSFDKTISGAGNLIKEGSTIVTLEGTNTYTGSTSIDSGKLIAETTKAINGSDATSGVLIAAGAVLEMKLDGIAESGTLAKNIAGAGSLEKTGADSALLLTGNNSFTGGSTLSSGQLTLGSDTALGMYTGIGLAGVVAMLNDSTTLSSDGSARTVQNFVQIADGLNGTGVTITTGGGDLTLNSLSGSEAVIQVGTGSGSTLNLSSTQDMFINGAVSGSGTLNKDLDGIVQIAADSTFSGITNLNAGTLRITDGKTFGYAASGTIFNVGVGGTLAGGGVIKADTITVNGQISTDKAILASGNTTIGGVEKYGSLTLDGDVTLDGFSFQYNADSVGLGAVDPAAVSSWAGDLLKLTGGNSILKGGVVDLQGTISSGNYLLVDSSTNIQIDPNKVLDGLNYSNGVLGVNYGGQALETSDGPRGSYALEFAENMSGIDDGQIWLVIDRNSLTMDWTATGGTKNWGDGNWVSRQQSTTGVSSNQFNNGDYTIFVNNSGGLETITLVSDVMTSGFELSGSDDFMFNGVGGIRVADQIESGIEGRYLLGGSGVPTGTPTITVDGRLQKSGSGTLTFENVGVNQFEGGITISGGTIAFNNARQLGTMNQAGTVDKGILFTDNAALFANDDIADLANDIYIADGKVASFGVADGKTMTMSSTIAGVNSTDVSGINKTGTGRLELAGVSNTYQGQTSISAGTLAITNAAAVGSTSDIFVDNSATFELNYSADGVFAKNISGAGGVLKAGSREVGLTEANTFDGGTTVQAGTLALQHSNAGVIDAAGTGRIVLPSMASTLRLDSDGLLNNTLEGVGNLIVNSDAKIQQDNSSYTGKIAINSTKSLTLDHTTDVTMVNDFSGSGEFIKDGSAQLTLTGDTGWTGDTALNQGYLVLDGSTGGADLVSTLTSVANTQFELKNNATFRGTINVGGGASSDVVVGVGTTDWSMTNNSTVNSLALDGQLHFVAPTSNGNITGFSTPIQAISVSGFKTLNIATKLSGNGHIYMNTDLRALKGDKIVTNETVGSHVIHVTNRGGTPTAPGQALELVDIQDQTKANGTFTLNGNHVDVGAYRYTLGKGAVLPTGLGAKANNWYLFNAGDYSSLNRQSQAFASTVRYIAGASLGNVSRRMGELHNFDDMTKRISHDFWINTTSKRYENNMLAEQSADQQVNSIEMGLDRNYLFDSSQVYVGGLVGMTHSKLSHETEGKAHSKTVQIGVYATWVSDSGTYLNLVGRHFWFKNDYTFGDDFEQEKGNNRSRAYTVDLELGHKIGFSNDWFITPQVELNWLYATRSRLTTNFGNHVVYDDANMFTGRVGVEAGKEVKTEDRSHRFYGRIDRSQNLHMSSDVLINGSRFKSPKEDGAWNAAIGYELNNKTNHFFIEPQTGLGHSDIKQKWGINAGMRWSF